jgi:hypothetical protein
MTPSQKLAAVLSLTLALLGGAGCHRQRVQAAAPPPAPLPKNASPQPAPTPPSTNTPAPENKPAETAGETPANPAPESPAPKPATPRPHVTPASPPIAETPPAPRPVPPQIRPRLSPEQVAEYKRKTNEAIAEAEKNLQSVYGRPLNESQRDLVEKIRGFLSQAHEAADSEDWGRAANLAEKARLISLELVNSL